MNKLFIFLISAFVALNCAFADTQKAPVADADKAASSNQAESDYISDQLKLAPKSYHDENRQLSYKINAVYPHISGDNLTPAAVEFNSLVSSLVKTEIDRFKRYVTADMPHMQNLPEDIKHNSLNIDYDTDVIRPNGDTIISIRLSIEGMQAGRAHPYHTNVVLNYSLTQNKTLTLEGLFKPKSAYLKIFSEYSRKKLNEKLSDKWMITDGTKPLAKNFKNWNLEADGITFTFDEYQVAPYVEGAQEVTIPYSELKNVLSPDAPISSCIDDKKTCLVQAVIPEVPEKVEENSVAI